MGVNVIIDDALLAEAVEKGRFGSEKAAVEEALRRLIADERRRRALEDIAGTGWEGDLDAMREGRANHGGR